jgi:hypothetical protein
MNEHTLPDDLSRWPANPFDLLGVRPGVSDRDLRRAYARLIRAYKPEQFPEHFRRIREAYEAARQYAQYFAIPEEAPADSPAPPHVPPTPVPDIGTPTAERPLPAPRPRSLQDELDDAWRWAEDGDEARAYARLLDLDDRHPGRTDIYLRLYCLLSAAPELDGRRTACDFLARGLRQSGGGGPCYDLYRHEIEANPGEALTGRFAELLGAITQLGLLTAFVEWRWGAAGRLKRFEVIRGDLPGLRARLAVDQEEVWLRLLASAADQLAWDRAAPEDAGGWAECLNEAEGYQHLQLRCADVFDRLEYLEGVATGWHTLMDRGNVPANLLELLPRFWTLPFSEIRRGVTSVLSAVAAAPAAWLTHLDRINEVSPELLSLFGGVLTAYQRATEPDADGRTTEELAVVARHFLDEQLGLSYKEMRPQLLGFCLREFIDPELIARLDNLHNDWPLRHVYRACTLLWA